MSLAAVAAAVVFAAAPMYECDRALCNPEALDPFFARLLHATDGGRPRTVHILQIGDSHSAGDSITGPWRAALQAKFGSGGRGVLPPGKPFDGFLPHGVHVDQSAGWTAENTFRTDPASPDAFGISGYRLTAALPGAQLMLTAEPAEAFREVVVCAQTGIGAGAYTITLGAISARITLGGTERRIDCESVASDVAQTQAVLVTDSGPVTLTSWGSFSGSGGIAVSNLGVVGAELKHFARTDDQALREEFSAYRPDLIVLEFGTNDGFVGHFSAATFESRLKEQIRRVRRLSAGTPIMIIGAPDAETKRGDLKHNQDPSERVPDEAGLAPSPLADPAAAAEPENPDEAVIAEVAARAERDTGERAAAWFSPPALAQVRAIEREVALESGVAFWDWAQSMGGPGSADRWARAVPPLARGDRVHTTSAGGVQVAAMLEADFERAFQAYRASR
jgi:hypothetical protein